MPDATPAIVVRDLRKVYDGKAAVDGLSLTGAARIVFWLPRP
jgi:hypothetical protein